MTLKNGPPFHFTVNREGVVSLWDTEELAKAQKDEAYVPWGVVPGTKSVGAQMQRAFEHALEQLAPPNNLRPSGKMLDGAGKLLEHLGRLDDKAELAIVSRAATVTRHGVYLKVRAGLVTTVYFVGTDVPTNTVIAEIVGP